MADTLTLEQSLEVEHIAQSLLILPRKVVDMRFSCSEVRNLREGTKQILQLRIKSVDLYDKSSQLIHEGHKRRAMRAVITFEDRHGVEIRGSSFMPYSWLNNDNIEMGAVHYLQADVETYKGKLQVNNGEVLPRYLVKKVNPIYPAIRKKADSQEVFMATRTALEHHLSDAADYLLASAGFRASEFESMTGMPAKDFIKALHAPETPESWEAAMEAAKQFSMLEVLAKSERIRNRDPEKQSMLLTTPVTFEGVTPTGDQDKAIDEIFSDLRSGFPMRRMVSGDVGTGKTLPIVGAIASVWRAYKAQGTHKNIAIMVPNDNLVNQVIGQIKRFFPDVECTAVSGKAKKKNLDYSTVLVGTSALSFLKDYVADFLLIDEQHKFSREQREAISKSYTNILEATATAIPRSIALITHGGMEVSILRQCPVVKKIKSYLVDDENRHDMYRAMQDAVARGKRILIVYPLVKASKASDAQTVEQGYNAWKTMFGDRVCMAHGQMTNEQKNDAIQSMKDGSKQVLVSSSIVEVGMDVADIEIMLVMHPQRYGMNQLHQLRGRLVRNGGVGGFFMYPEEELNEIELARLQAIEETTDGFEISQRDMELRGFGDLASDSEDQNGASSVTFRGIALMPSDFDNMNSNKQEVQKRMAP